MLYIMKSGYLFSAKENKPVAQIKNILWSQEKTIHLLGQNTSFKATAESTASAERRGDVRQKRYFLYDKENSVLLIGQPAYAECDNPDVVGWPICRLPKADHAQIQMGKETYRLNMMNNQYYSMRDQNGYDVLQILHRGITGGWEIQADAQFAPEIISALFLFCRYLEQENEFLVV